ncbi:MAG: hypothetical protein IJT30_09520, partial [Muribaculaceae bacterium]|nr:hypothetical protein [Muribaculaceae bacterium]
LTDHEVSMTLTALKNATAREDIQKSVDRLTDLMLNHQVGEGKRTMAKLLKTKGTRVNQSGVQVAAGLDPHGARAIEAARNNTSSDSQRTMAYKKAQKAEDIRADAQIFAYRAILNPLLNQYHQAS